MPLAKGLLVSSGERRTYKILQKHSDSFKVFTKVRFFDVIEWHTPNISQREHQYLEKTHFDFVVCGAEEPFKPLFGVEFDGIGEDAESIDPYRNLKKKTKSRVCKSEGFPLIWLEFENIQDVEGHTMLNFIIDNYMGIDIVFRPTLNLLKKYNHLIMDSSIEDINHKGGWVEVIRTITFETQSGLKKITRSARTDLNNFPSFGSSVIHFTDDMAEYECLRVLDSVMKAGSTT